MALATTCPQCKTSFRVVPDQLKLRRGYVRCGRCRHVFAGIDHLRHVDEARLRGEPQATNAEREHEADAAAHAQAKAVEDAQAADGNEAGERVAEHPDAQRIDAVDDDVEWIVVDVPTFEDAAQSDDAGLASETAAEERSTEEPLMTEAPPIDAMPAEAPVAKDRIESDAVAETALDEPPPPHYVERFADSLDREAHESAIDYFSTKRARGFADRRGLAGGLLALALAVALAMQWVVAQRSAIAANLPFVAPLLGAALAPFGLRIEAPSELDELTIESFELQASDVPDVLEMRALLRNRADHPVRWPSMQLTLTDPDSRVLVRRALHPAEYLAEAGEVRSDGVPARTEWPLRLALEARDLQATGYDYRVQLFYP